MKLAFSTLPFTGCDVSLLESVCKRFNLSAEVRANPDGTYLSGEFPITDIGSSICLKTGSDSEKERFIAAVNNFHKNGVKAIRVFLGNFRQRWDAPQDPLDEDGIVSLLKDLCDIGPEIWIETHNEYATGASLLPLLMKVNKPNLGIIWDILHPIEDDEPYTKTWQLLKPYIRHIHIKDAMPNPDKNYHDWFYTKIGEGTVPIKEIVSLVLSDGYDGYFSLEWENLWRKELADLYPNKEELLHDYISFMEALI